ncbi:hypothetical protein EN45_061550 [Penicillium chrysogenum]|uniref:Uncharacterized protein n=1 Tax=Penicillium chrysogenum TaxID=5076 RepID=A0A167SVR7_PENCH|nr:hypothetical protein EN45_061550 [Penicillium chrysogenum]
MESPNSSPDQEKEEQQPSELPMLSDKDNNVEPSDHVLPLHIDLQKIEQSNEILKEAGTHLRKERDGLQLHHDKQLARLRFFEHAMESSRERLINLLDDWNYPYSPNLAGLTDVAREE